MRSCCVFSGLSHPQLVESICERLGQKPSQVESKKFSNGETSVEISMSYTKWRLKYRTELMCWAETSVRDQEIFIVQSGSSEYVEYHLNAVWESLTELSLAGSTTMSSSC